MGSPLRDFVDDVNRTLEIERNTLKREGILVQAILDEELDSHESVRQLLSFVKDLQESVFHQELYLQVNLRRIDKDNKRLEEVTNSGRVPFLSIEGMTTKNEMIRSLEEVLDALREINEIINGIKVQIVLLLRGQGVNVVDNIRGKIDYLVGRVSLKNKTVARLQKETNVNLNLHMLKV
tara:strand:- start:118 stop:654 length:537 start_codon:yes stop_codon:yes gene_type:complete